MHNPAIPAIATVYGGHQFRSRLEARWSVFLDHLGVDWVYEPEGFVLGDGTWYLPDFYLPTFGTWLEVKGSGLNVAKTRRAADELPLLVPPRTHGPRLLVVGSPPRSDRLSAGNVGWDAPLHTHHVGVWGFTKSRLQLLTTARRDMSTSPTCVRNAPLEHGVVRAYNAARTAQFEFGDAARDVQVVPVRGTEFTTTIAVNPHRLHPYIGQERVLSEPEDSGRSRTLVTRVVATAMALHAARSTPPALPPAPTT